LLHSIPKQEHGIEALGESEFGLFEWRRRAFSTVKCKGQERRAIGSGGIYTELSQKKLVVGLRFKFRTKSRGSQTMSDWDSLWEDEALSGLVGGWEFLFWMVLKRT
jgi:hypothetical protein